MTVAQRGIRRDEAHRTTGMEEDGEPARLSDLDAALLGLLSIRPTSGYDIRQHYARALAPWWETPRTQIYPRLRDLQRRGLIDNEYVVQQDRPNKRLYSITASGTDALTSWLGSRIAWPDMRHHMMMRLFFGNLLSEETIRKQLTDYRDRMKAWSSSLRSARKRFSESLVGPYRESVLFELLSLEHLIALADLERKGADAALTTIEKANDLLDDRANVDPSQLLEAIRELLD